MVRIKKKEVEQDKFITLVTKTLDWVKSNSQTVLAILVGIALGIAVTFFYRSYKAESYQASLELLNQADELYYRNVKALSGRTAEGSKETKSINPLNKVELEEAIEKYDELIEEYPSTSAASFALFNKGNAAFLAEKYDVAIEAYKEFLNRMKTSSPIKEIAQENLIISYIEKKDYDSAIKEIKKDFKQSRRDEFKAKLLFRLGKIYESQGKSEEAIKTYKKIEEEFKETTLSSKASTRLNYLEASSPESQISP